MLRLQTLGLLLAILMLLGACGDDGGDGDGASGQSAGQASAGQSGASAGQSAAGQGGSATCNEQACLACFEMGDFANCLGVCAGCEDDDEGGGGGVGAAGEGGGGSVPAPNCMTERDCGISQECLSCSLTASEGHCVFRKECTFHGDCASDERCGYNVENSAYRCLPAALCQ